MQNCLGIYIESHLIKYAKVSKEKDTFKVESFGVNFLENISLADAIKKIVEETYSFSTPICINLSNENYLYYNIFSLLSKNDVQRSVQTEFEAYCDENKYNQNAFETRYALVQNVEDKEKIKAIQIVVNKIELNRQKQPLEKYRLTRISPVGTAIASVAKLEKKENVLIVNMEENTTITTVIDRQVYNVDTIDNGSQEVLAKINKVENSLSKAYSICKETTIYTSSVVEGTKEQPYLQYIVPTLYQICQKVQQIVSESHAKISTVYLTGTLSSINNVDLYFQEFLSGIDCKILRPSIVEEKTGQINIKDYIEVNTPISLALQGLGEGIQALNFKNMSFMDQLKQALTADVGSKKLKGTLKAKGKENKTIDFSSFKSKLSDTETMLLRAVSAIILINIIFIIFTKVLMTQMNKKQTEIEGLISTQNAEIDKVNKDTNSLNSKNTKYKSLIEELNAINNKISDIAACRNSIPNLLNQIMYGIPDNVQLISIKNTTNRHIQIVAQSTNYDALGYFLAKIKVGQILNNAISSSGVKNGDTVTITIEGDLP